MSTLGSFISLAYMVAGTVINFYAPGAGNWLYAAAMAVNMVDGANDARRAKRKARDDYNNSLEDRMEMVDLSADQARTVALGRVRAVEGVRRRWVSGANSEKLTMVVSFAGHEIDGFEAYYFDDVALTLDGSGWVQTAPWAVTTPTPQTPVSGTLDGSGNGSVTLPTAPLAGTVFAVWHTGSGENSMEGHCGVSVAGAVVTLSAGQPSAAVEVSYSVNVTRSYARIRPYLGTAAQNVGSDLAAEYPGKITATDRFAGIALAVVDVEYEPDIFPQGRPNITARLRGAKMYDPRLDSTNGGSGSHRLATPSTWAFSENPALHAYHWARLASGWAVPAAEIKVADIAAAATACDVSTVFAQRMPDNSLVNLPAMPRHRCGIVLKTSASPRAGMDAIVATMAGRWGWAGGTLRLRAGTMAGSVFALQPSWIAQRVGDDGEPDTSPVIRITNGVTREQRVNRVSGKCINPAERWQALPYPAVQDAALITQDGAIFPDEIDYEGVNHPAHAQHLGSILIRQTQAALRMQAQCNLSAYRCELFDVGTVTLPRFGMSAQTYEVQGWRWHPSQGVQLTLGEIASAMFTPDAELKGMDPAPNSDLPAPWDVDQVVGVSVTSGTAALTDGSVLTRTRVAWTAAAQQSVRSGGQIEVQYRDATGTLPGSDWPSWEEQGAATSTIIPGLRSNAVYLFRVRAVQGLPRVRGPWSATVSHLVAPTPSGLNSAISINGSGQIVGIGSGAGTAVANAQITISAAGTLAGAGGGAVTIGGLGYTGSLDANRGSVGGYANSDPFLQNTAEWTTGGAAYTTATQVAPGWINAFYNTVARNIFSAPFPVSQLATYQIEGAVWRATTTGSFHYLFVQFFDAAGAFCTAANVGWPGSYAPEGYRYWGLVNATPAASGPNLYSLTFGAEATAKIPSNAVTAKVGIFANYTGSDEWYWGGARVRDLAEWARVVGTGKPADDATKNIVTYSASAPGSPVNGDLWCDTTVSTAPTWKIRVSGAWQSASTLGAPSGTYVGGTLAETVVNNAANGNSANTALTTAFTVAISGGDFNYTTATSATGVSLGSRSATPTGGTGTITYSWALAESQDANNATIWVDGSSTSITLALLGTVATGGDATRIATVTARDANGRVAIATIGATIVSTA